jgi:hypothetical protein
VTSHRQKPERPERQLSALPDEQEIAFLEREGWLNADERELWLRLARDMIECVDLCTQRPVN